MATYNVGGFTFTSEAEAKRARQELQAIKDIKSRTNISNPAVAKQILYNCKTKEIFKTEVGTDFLSELQQTAKNSVDNKQFNKSVNNTPVNKRVTSTDNKQFNELVNNTPVKKFTYVDNRKVTYVDNGRVDNSMYCKHCGSMLEDATPFCPNCGKPVQPTVHTSKNKNVYCVAAFICGLVSFFVLPYMSGIGAIVCGIIGIATFDDQNNTNKWQGITGLILGILGILSAFYTFWY